MKQAIIEVEYEYSSVFSKMEKTAYGQRYTDDALPDMHCHNFIRIDKEKAHLIERVIESEREFRKENKNPVEQVEIFDCDRLFLNDKVNSDMLTEQILMYAEAGDLEFPGSINEKTVSIAGRDEHFSIGRSVDMLAFGREFEDFASRRYERKEVIYRDPDVDLNNFICFSEREPIGNCDFFFKNGFGKIEDFDVLEKYQRKGFGSRIFKSIVYYGVCNNITRFFLQVESENSAKKMYENLGFRPLFNNLIYKESV